MNELNPAIGQPTHAVHYAGQSFAVMPEHAVRVARAIVDARYGTITCLRLKATVLDSGVSAEIVFNVGPGIPVAVIGPPLTDWDGMGTRDWER